MCELHPRPLSTSIWLSRASLDDVLFAPVAFAASRVATLKLTNDNSLLSSRAAAATERISLLSAVNRTALNHRLLNAQIDSYELVSFYHPRPPSLRHEQNSVKPQLAFSHKHSACLPASPTVYLRLSLPKCLICETPPRQTGDKRLEGARSHLIDLFA